jgi:hypothetical protein
MSALCRHVYEIVWLNGKRMPSVYEMREYCQQEQHRVCGIYMRSDNGTAGMNKIAASPESANNQTASQGRGKSVPASAFCITDTIDCIRIHREKVS